MQKVTLLCVGKLKESFYISAVAEYQKRLQRHCQLSIVELPEQKLPENPSAAEIEQALSKEAAAIGEKIPKGSTLIAMCIEGKQLSSEGLAEKIAEIKMQSSTIDFIIGGSLGLSDEVKNRADFRLSMSAMTFPHRIARLMLEEQIYRAFKINANETYHK
jgi:23S rRNA (pseudouridine1915-N3)-methyltransferase